MIEARIEQSKYNPFPKIICALDQGEIWKVFITKQNCLYIVYNKINSWQSNLWIN